MPQVEVPPPYRGPTLGNEQIDVEGQSVGECLHAVGARFPGFDDQIFDAKGAVHRFVTLFVNGDEIERSALDTPVSGDDAIRILAAIAGG
jgi:molybdopterin converting factor small subunit